MRIISKFQDFYDSGLSYGIDPTLVYVREREEIYESHNWRQGSTEYNNRVSAMRQEWSTNRRFFDQGDDREYRSSDIFLSFCGQRFLGIERESWPRPGLGSRDRRESDVRFEYYWSAAEADQISSTTRWPHRGEGREDVWPPKQDNWANLKYGCPVVLERPGHNMVTVIKNPCLKEIGFSWVIDPYTAFQEIAMYLAGPLSGWEDPDLEPEPTGVEKMDVKGMDSQYGFRKRPKEK